MSVSVYICFGDLSAIGDTVSVCRVCVRGSCGVCMNRGADGLNLGSGVCSVCQCGVLMSVSMCVT